MKWFKSEELFHEIGMQSTSPDDPIFSKHLGNSMAMSCCFLPNESFIIAELYYIILMYYKKTLY